MCIFLCEMATKWPLVWVVHGCGLRCVVGLILFLMDSCKENSHSVGPKMSQITFHDLKMTPSQYLVIFRSCICLLVGQRATHWALTLLLLAGTAAAAAAAPLLHAADAAAATARFMVGIGIVHTILQDAYKTYCYCIQACCTIIIWRGSVALTIF